MARKYIGFQEVAALLGISQDDLSDMRSRGEIHGYRDGNTWKFKIEEVQRVASDRGITLGESALAGEVPLAGDSVFLSSVDEELDVLSEVDSNHGDPGESVLVTEDELNPADEKEQVSPSTVIGGRNVAKDSDADAPNSDQKLTNDSNDEGADIELVVESSDVLSAGSSSNNLSDNAVQDPQIDNSRVEGMSDELTLQPSSSSDLAAGESLSLGESDLQLADSSSVMSGGEASESVSIDLDFDDDDDLVLGNPGTGSDVTLTPADSGISLSTPSDTGLSLTDGPLDLSAAESALELPEGIVGDEAETSGTDDDFLLTPVEEASDEESDSGSQVIAIDSDDSYEEDAANLLGSVEDVPLSEADAEIGGGVAVSPTIAAPVASLEPKYSITNIIFLSLATILLSITGLCMYDVVRHMWSWEEPYAINSALMDWIISTLVGG